MALQRKCRARVYANVKHKYSRISKASIYIYLFTIAGPCFPAHVWELSDPYPKTPINDKNVTFGQFCVFCIVLFIPPHALCRTVASLSHCAPAFFWCVHECRGIVCLKSGHFPAAQRGSFTERSAGVRAARIRRLSRSPGFDSSREKSFMSAAGIAA